MKQKRLLDIKTADLLPGASYLICQDGKLKPVQYSCAFFSLAPEGNEYMFFIEGEKKPIALKKSEVETVVKKDALTVGMSSRLFFALEIGVAIWLGLAILGFPLVEQKLNMEWKPYHTGLFMLGYVAAYAGFEYLKMKSLEELEVEASCC